MNKQRLKAQLKVDEGRRPRIYDDTGVPITPKGKITVGYGRNMSDRDLSEGEMDLMLENDIDRTTMLLDKYLPWWRSLSDGRQEVLANMAYNLGVGPSTEDPTGKLLTFKNTLAAMKAGRTEDVLSGLTASLWAKQVGKRATRLLASWEQG
jgi:lysozyme